MNTFMNILTWSLITAGFMLIAVVIGVAFLLILEKINGD